MLDLLAIIWILSMISYSTYMFFFCKKGEKHERISAAILGSYLAAIIGPFIFLILYYSFKNGDN